MVQQEKYGGEKSLDIAFMRVPINTIIPHKKAPKTKTTLATMTSTSIFKSPIKELLQKKYLENLPFVNMVNRKEKTPQKYF
ncbi:hypothetical protein [Bartonella pachyuromydis]|uniref:Uncharacterized protein n=1 Tax=Bartonella pachyuromydis TaxID=931097 RepID=A0ABP8VJT3_9HYPH